MPRRYNDESMRELVRNDARGWESFDFSDSTRMTQTPWHWGTPTPTSPFNLRPPEPPLTENLDMFNPPKINVAERFSVNYDPQDNATVTIDGDVFKLKHKDRSDDAQLLKRFQIDLNNPNGPNARSVRKFMIQAKDIKKAEIIHIAIPDTQLAAIKASLTEKLKVREASNKELLNSLRRTTFINYNTVATYLLGLFDYERYKEVLDAVSDLLADRDSEMYIAPINDFCAFWKQQKAGATPKATKYQYLLSAIGKESVFIDIPLPADGQVYQLTKVKLKENTPVAITSKTLYSAYSQDLGEFLKYYRASYKGINNIEQMVLNDIARNRQQGNVCAAFHRFNLLKSNLIIYGESEAQAVQTILNDAKIDDKEVFTCSITKQLLPTFFRVHLGEQMLSAYYVAMNSKQSDHPTRMGGANPYYIERVNDREAEVGYRYTVIRNMPSEDSFKYSVFRDHMFNALTYLSPRKSMSCCNKLTTYHSAYIPTPYLGVELEVEQNSNWKPHDVDIMMPKLNVTDDVYNVLGRDFVILKHDGSLSGHNPFEIVSIPATLQYHKERWKPFLESETKKYLKSYTTSTCGMHVHISREAFTGLHLAKFMRFINMLENKHFVETVAQRSANDYTRYQDLPLKEHIGNLDGRKFADQGSLMRRQAVNCTNAKTVEVRIFKGNLGTISFLKNLEFVHSLYYYTKECAIGDLSYKKYLLWLLDPSNSDDMYTNLRLWLVKKNFNIDSVVIKKDTPPELIKKLEVQQKSIKSKKEIINRRLVNKRFSKDDACNKQAQDQILAAS